MDEEKRPLLSGEFAWTVSRKDGKLSLRIGPDPLELTDDDIPMKPDSTHPGKPIRSASAADAIQQFVVLEPGQYAVVHSPVDVSRRDREDGYPNGMYSSGRNDMKSLSYGRKMVITAGHFPVWPGQVVEIRPVHHVASDEYIVVQVEGDVDASAPYYDLTVECAEIKSVVVDDTVATEGEAQTTEDRGEEKEPTDEDLEDALSGRDQPTDLPPPPKAQQGPRFVVGQRIIIPGSKTPTYIPPTGVEILGDIEDMAARPDVMPKGLRGQRFGRMRAFASSGRPRGRVVEEYMASPDGESMNAALYAAQVAAETATAEAVWEKVVQKAVVLGPTEFCVTLDKDGHPRPHKGPGRVFPGPDDRFRTEGADNRIYAAFHLREDRGILIRVVADQIEKAELAEQLRLDITDERKAFRKGDELFIKGVDAYLVPPSTVQVINPKTGLPHLGNDHSDVFVPTIGIDQKSGVYVEDHTTGVVELVRGQKTLLLDPRYKKHQKRAIPNRLWDLVIGHTEPHKKTSEPSMQGYINKGRMITPWALSVQVPNNEAMLVVSRSGRRVVLGPRTELLDYEEIPEVLTLSRGKPKEEDHVLETCFLRVKGNRISDQIELVTSDHVIIKVDVEYGVEFVGGNEADQEMWFEFKNYVWLLCTNLRSRLRGAAQQRTLDDLYGHLSEFVRDTILGTKGEEEEHRPGLKFEENNMHVVEVEVLDFRIPDERVSEALKKANRDAVHRQIEDTEQEALLVSERKRDEIAAERDKIKEAAAKRTIAEVERQHNIDTRSSELMHERDTERQKQKQVLEMARAEIEKMVAEGEVASKKIREDHEVAHQREVDKLEIEREEKLGALQRDLAIALSEADAKRLEAITPRLVEALEGLGRRDLAKALAENLPAATGEFGYLFQVGGMRALKVLASGTPAEKALDTLFPGGNGETPVDDSLPAGGEDSP